MAFLAFGKNFNFKKSKYKFIWFGVLLASLLYPFARELFFIDKCLDSGGSWDSAYFECKK